MQEAKAQAEAEHERMLEEKARKWQSLQSVRSIACQKFCTCKHSTPRHTTQPETPESTRQHKHRTPRQHTTTQAQHSTTATYFSSVCGHGMCVPALTHALFGPNRSDMATSESSDTSRRRKKISPPSIVSCLCDKELSTRHTVGDLPAECHNRLMWLVMLLGKQLQTERANGTMHPHT